MWNGNTGVTRVVAWLIGLAAVGLLLPPQRAGAGTRLSDAIQFGIHENNEPSDFTFSITFSGANPGFVGGSVAFREASGQLSDIVTLTVSSGGPTTLFAIHVDSSDPSTLPAGAKVLSETGGFQDLTQEFRDSAGNPITAPPFGVQFSSDTSEAGTGSSEGLRILLYGDLEPSIMDMGAGFISATDLGLHDAAVALTEPTAGGEGDTGSISDVVRYSSLGTFALLSLQSDLDPGLPSAPPAHTTFMDETGDIQDLTSNFVDTAGNRVTLPFDVSVQSDIMPEPSALAISSILLAVFGAGSLRKRLRRTAPPDSERGNDNAVATPGSSSPSSARCSC